MPPVLDLPPVLDDLPLELDLPPVELMPPSELLPPVGELPPAALVAATELLPVAVVEPPVPNVFLPEPELLTLVSLPPAFAEPPSCASLGGTLDSELLQAVKARATVSKRR